MSIVTSQSVFNEMYWKSKSPAVRALRGMTTPETIEQRPFVAANLVASEGVQIDFMIDVLNSDPYMSMLFRSKWGYRSTPSMYMPPTTNLPDDPYKLGIPPGAIKVSLDSDDYPPFDKPVTPAAEQKLSYGVMGLKITDTTYGIAPNDMLPVGSEVNTPEGKFIKRGSPSPFGLLNARWEKV